MAWLKMGYCIRHVKCFVFHLKICKGNGQATVNLTASFNLMRNQICEVETFCYLALEKTPSTLDQSGDNVKVVIAIAYPELPGVEKQ